MLNKNSTCLLFSLTFFSIFACGTEVCFANNKDEKLKSAIHFLTLGFFVDSEEKKLFSDEEIKNLENKKKFMEKTDWYKTLQKNLNAASIGLGVYTTFNFIYSILAILYETNFSLPRALEKLKKQRVLNKAVRGAWLAISIEIFNQYFSRAKYKKYTSELTKPLEIS